LVGESLELILFRLELGWFRLELLRLELWLRLELLWLRLELLWLLLELLLFWLGCGCGRLCCLKSLLVSSQMFGSSCCNFGSQSWNIVVS